MLTRPEWLVHNSSEHTIQLGYQFVMEYCLQLALFLILLCFCTDIYNKQSNSTHPVRINVARSTGRKGEYQSNLVYDHNHGVSMFMCATFVNNVLHS